MSAENARQNRRNRINIFRDMLLRPKSRKMSNDLSAERLADVSNTARISVLSLSVLTTGMNLRPSEVVVTTDDKCTQRLVVFGHEIVILQFT